MKTKTGSVLSKDGGLVYFESTGQGQTALIFVHGWLGNLRWWDNQVNAFSDSYQVVTLDLVGHGKSSNLRKNWSVQSYAYDIQAVVQHLGLKQVILVGHSMSGSNVVEAYSLLTERVKKVILVDTLTDLDHMPGMQEVAPLFAGLRADYQGTIEVSFRQYMFTPKSPAAVVEKLVGEGRLADPVIAIRSLEPFYSTDMRESCKKVRVPVRAINSTLYPTSLEANRKYFSDFDCEIISEVGHYPMLEVPEKFNQALRRLIR